MVMLWVWKHKSGSWKKWWHSGIFCKIDPFYDVASKVKVEFKIPGNAIILFCLNVKKYSA